MSVAIQRHWTKYSAEWIEGYKQGYQEGYQEGLQQGLKQGQQKQAIDMLQRLLERKFGDLPDQLQQPIEILSTAQADELTLALFDDLTFAEVEARLDEQV